MLLGVLTIGAWAVESVSTTFSLTLNGVSVGLPLLIGRIGCQQSIPGCAVPTLFAVRRVTIRCHLTIFLVSSTMCVVQLKESEKTT